MARTPAQQAYDREYRARNAEKIRAYEKARRQTPAIRERNREASRRYRAANPNKVRAAINKSSRKRCGVVDATGETRTGECPICLGTFAVLCCDHDHETGAIRGWLCHRCNVGLGHYSDSPARLRRAAAYLEKA